MKKLILVLSAVLMILRCQNKIDEKSILEGDLYYSWLNIENFYNQPDSLYLNYIKLRDSIGIEELRKQDSNVTSQIELLEKHRLEKSPFIYLKTDSDSIFIIFMSFNDYQPITHYSYQNLIDKKQKVRLKIQTDKLTHKLQVCKKILSIEEVDGKTFEKQKKFKIDDYK